MKKDPKDRPTSAELFHCGIIPLSEEDKYIDVALSAVKHKSSTLYHSLMETMFSLPLNDALDYTYDGTLTGESVGLLLIYLFLFNYVRTA